MRLTVILPTLCRPSLWPALVSCRGADEVLVCPDGPAALARARQLVAWGPWAGWVQVLDVGGPHGDWGHTPTNRALAHATGGWLARLDDDDVYAPGALAMLRTLLATAPPVPHLFRAESRSGLVWREPRLELGNVTTGGIVVPNDPARLGRWGTRYEGDYDFARCTVDLYGGHCVWREEVLVRLGRPAQGSRPTQLRAGGGADVSLRVPPFPGPVPEAP